MWIIAKIFSAFFGFFVISKSYADLKRKRENPIMFGFWVATWSIIIAISFFPQIITWLIGAFDGQGAGLGTVFGLAITFLFFIIYRVYIKADRVERALNKLISDMAVQGDGGRSPKRK